MAYKSEFSIKQGLRINRGKDSIELVLESIEGKDLMKTLEMGVKGIPGVKSLTIKRDFRPVHVTSEIKIIWYPEEEGKKRAKLGVEAPKNYKFTKVDYREKA